MSEPIEPYACSRGTVLAHDGSIYIIATTDGRTIGIAAASGEPGPANVEADILASEAPDLPAIRARLRARATERRWQVETAGITIAGVQVATDDRAKTLLTGADRKARRDPAFVTRWKGEDGTWADVNAATVIAIADAVFDHVNACFAREEALHAAIAAAADAGALEALVPEIEAFELPI